MRPPGDIFADIVQIKAKRFCALSVIANVQYNVCFFLYLGLAAPSSDDLFLYRQNGGWSKRSLAGTINPMTNPFATSLAR